MPKYLKSLKKRKSSGSLLWGKAPDVEERAQKLIKASHPEWETKGKIHFFRSENSKARAYARIWGLPKLWQIALKQKPSYIIEVLSEKYDSLPSSKKDDVLLHELAHIPKNFSGSLVPHYRKGKRKFHDRVRELAKNYQRGR